MQRLWPLVSIVALVVGTTTGCDSSSPFAPSSASTSNSVVTSPPPVASEAGIQIAGHVYDRIWRPLAGARVEVLDGPQTGLATTTSASGEFRLSGAFDETTRFRATMPNHREATLTLPDRCAPCNPNWWLYFALETEAPPVNVAGDYRLTFIADASCSTLPESFHRRTYDASIRPFAPGNVSQFRVTVTGGSFLDRQGAFDLGVAGDMLAVVLGDFHGTPGVAERVAANTYLGYEGAATAKLSSLDVVQIAAPFDGVISYCELSQEPAAWYACVHSTAVARVLCASANHQIVLQRR